MMHVYSEIEVAKALIFTVVIIFAVGICAWVAG